MTVSQAACNPRSTKPDNHRVQIQKDNEDAFVLLLTHISKQEERSSCKSLVITTLDKTCLLLGLLLIYAREKMRCQSSMNCWRAQDESQVLVFIGTAVVIIPASSKRTAVPYFLTDHVKPI